MKNMIDFWVDMVKSGYSIDKVPTKYRDAVKRKMNG